MSKKAVTAATEIAEPAPEVEIAAPEAAAVPVMTVRCTRLRCGVPGGSGRRRSSGCLPAI